MALPLYYIAGFSTSGTAQSMTIDAAAADTTVTAGTYAHATFAANTYVAGYTAFSAAIATALNTSLAGTYTVTFSTTTMLYTISRATAGFTLTFPATAAGARCKAALGFSSNSPSGAGTAGSPYVSDVRPIYLMVPGITARSDYSNVYEPNEIVSEAVSDGGTPYAVARQTSELWNDWQQTCEPLASTFVRSATAALPWTWQAMFKHCRGQHPFAVYESAMSSSTAHKFRADGASFVPQRYATDYDGLWTIPFRTRDFGTV